MRLPTSIGPVLRTSDPYGVGFASPAEAARRAEAAGFRAVWIGDHLAYRVPWLEACASVAAAAAATTSAVVGHNVLLTAMRPSAWVVKHLQTLAVLAPDRHVLGVGVGGENREEWRAAGSNPRRRGRRTDDLLAVLPTLLAGGPAYLQREGVRVSALLPPTACPPVFVGGRTDAALGRAVRYGDAWIGAFMSPRRFAMAMSRLRELAAERGRAAPAAGLTVTLAVGADRARALEQARTFMKAQYSGDWDRLRQAVIAGSTAVVADALSELRTLGAAHLMLQGTAADALAEYEQLADVAAEVQPAAPSAG